MTMIEPELSGRIALVTGGSGGIGAALCRRLASSGVAVAVHYSANAAHADGVVATIEAHGGRAVAVKADLRNALAPEHLIAEVTAVLGEIDLLVANAGLATFGGYEDVDAAMFDEAIAVNLRAPYLLARAVLPGMRARRFGRVLFVSSVAGLTGGIVGPHYASAKSGLHGLTHYLAARVAADGVTVNSLAPGLIETGMLPGTPEELAGRVPVGRVGDPAEVADLAMAVLRNAYLTNQVISIDGGMYPR
ncbi:MAG TPA: SDR family NAD(P)-dependent oxidoreductase [Pseudonocardiaceae bacterium]|jgi:3-oxoacyl-[acyl-carrier protein] reductase|nr:SDR family NAD(P)-dependent oxidoreductase [Pseudonocardiaceae bacterium]